MLLWLACTASEPTNDTSVVGPGDTDPVAQDDSGGDGGDGGDDTAPFDPSQLAGEWIEEGGGPPLFAVQNHLDETRTSDDLAEGITVMWFYPAASTYG